MSEYTPPCGCITKFDGHWAVGDCDCRNTGDLIEAQAWCSEWNNHEIKEEMLNALKFARPFMAVMNLDSSQDLITPIDKAIAKAEGSD